MSTELLKDHQLAIAHAMKCAAEEYIAENTPEKVVQETLDYLDANRENILKSLLGFSVNSWGKGVFEVDHCNGRGGESAVGDYLRKVQSEAIKDWFDQAELGELGDDLKASMQKEYNKVYHSTITRYVKSHAEAEARKYVDALKEQDALSELAKMDSLLDT